MGLFSWWRREGKGNNNNNIQSESNPKPASQASVHPKPSPQSKPNSPADYPEVPGMNGAVAVPGASDLSELTIFEFGSVAASNSKFTMSGYCPVSNDLEPCVWQLDPASNPKEPLFRVVF